MVGVMPNKSVWRIKVAFVNCVEGMGYCVQSGLQLLLPI
jgi:hypothetical protein